MDIYNETFFRNIEFPLILGSIFEDDDDVDEDDVEDEVVELTPLLLPRPPPPLPIAVSLSRNVEEEEFVETKDVFGAESPLLRLTAINICSFDGVLVDTHPRPSRNLTKSTPSNQFSSEIPDCCK